MDKPTTILDEETDAEISPDADSTWIGVKQFSVYIKKTTSGIDVRVFARGAEDCDELDGCAAYDLDALAMQEEENEVDRD